MTDLDKTEWPREIWMAEREEYDQGILNVRTAQTEDACHRYVDADILESQERYYRHQIEHMLGDTEAEGDCMLNLWHDHKEWSEETFGTDRGPIGPLKHLIKEAEEAMDAPEDPHEYADCLFLVFDSARRAGHNYRALLEAAREKLEILKGRKYDRVPDGEPSFHKREQGE